MTRSRDEALVALRAVAEIEEAVADLCRDADADGAQSEMEAIARFEGGLALARTTLRHFAEAQQPLELEAMQDQFYGLLADLERLDTGLGRRGQSAAYSVLNAAWDEIGEWLT